MNYMVTAMKRKYLLWVIATAVIFFIVTNPTNASQPTEAEVIQSVLPSIVKISILADHGSGFFIGQHEIITAAHVVKEEGQIRITMYGGQTCTSTVKYKEDVSDMALLTTDCTGIPLTLSNESQVAETVYAFGNPDDMDFLVTKGMISSKGYGKILFDATVYEGSSGGALTNEQGEVIGLVYAKSVLVPIGWAIPANKMELFMAHVRKYTE